MTHMNEGIYGAKVKSFQKASTRELIKRICARLGIKKHSPENRTAVLEAFLREADKDQIHSLVVAGFANDWASTWGLTKSMGRKERADAKAQRVFENQQMEAAAYQDIINRAKVQHIFDAMTVLGKSYRHCTKADYIELRNIAQTTKAAEIRRFDRIIKAMPDTGEAGDAFSDDDFLSFWDT